MLTDLTLGSLPELDNGKVELMFQNELNRVIADVADRPDDQTARKVVLTLAIKPCSVGRRGLETTEVEATVSSSVPKLRTRPYECKQGPEGGLQFNADSPGDVRQETIPFEPNGRKAGG